MVYQHNSMEQREFDRVPLYLAATLSIASDNSIQDCSVLDLSVGGALLQYKKAPPPPGVVVRLSIKGFGDFEAVTARLAGFQTGVRFFPEDVARQNLLQKLTIYVAEGVAGFGTIQPPGPQLPILQLAFKRPGGERHQCDVSDISLRGVTLRTQARPPMGEVIRLGRTSGRVVEHNDDGIGVVFLMTG